MNLSILYIIIGMMLICLDLWLEDLYNHWTDLFHGFAGGAGMAFIIVGIVGYNLGV